MRRQKPQRMPLDIGGLAGSDALFRLSGAMRRDPAVELWLSDEPGELRSMAQRWFLQIRRCGTDVRELMHDGCPVACVDDAAFAYVNVFKNHVNVGFFYGATLADPARMLAGSGKRMRHVKLESGSTPNDEGLCDLIHAAYTDVKARLARE